jgi:hypothetical protein
MELPKNVDERNAYDNFILNANTGKGTVYTGGYYHVVYQSYIEDPKSMKCEGVELIILKNKDDTPFDFKKVVVSFTENLSVIDKLNGKLPRPFKERLKEGIDTQIGFVKEHDNHNKRVKETAEKVVKCQIKIDDMMSELTGGQAVSYRKMLEIEESNKQLPPGTNAFSEINLEAEEKKKEYFAESIDMLNNKNSDNGTNTVLNEVIRSKSANDMIMKASFRVLS